MTGEATLYIIQGFLGAGKTTFSKRLALKTGAVHLNPDEVCVSLFRREEYERNWDECFRKTLDLLWQKAEEHLKAGKDVIFDAGFWDRKSRDDAKSFARKCDCRCVHCYICVPDEVAKERLSLRKGRIAENNAANFENIKKSFVPPEPDEQAVVIHNC